MTSDKILVTKTFLPPYEEYSTLLKEIYESAWLTNNGKFVQTLESRIKEKLEVENFLYCSNGTIVLDMALKALDITKEVITTPYSYVATVNSILWRDCKPVFVDINNLDFTIDVNLIEKSITENTQAILATHVYGNPCDVLAIEQLANKYNLKVIYDAAHSFGVKYQGKSIMEYGDISTCSFHATKVFHTIEGGGIFARDKSLFDRLYKYRQFGHIYDEYYSIGINAKNSELHAAMGHCVLNHFDSIVAERKIISGLYNQKLSVPDLQRPVAIKNTDYNFAYYPVIFNSNSILIKVKLELEKEKIFPRRYFFPSLNTLPFVEKNSCPVSEKISDTVLCLPLFIGLSKIDIDRISKIILKNI